VDGELELEVEVETTRMEMGSGMGLGTGTGTEEAVEEATEEGTEEGSTGEEEEGTEVDMVEKIEVDTEEATTATTVLQSSGHNSFPTSSFVLFPSPRVFPSLFTYVRVCSVFLPSPSSFSLPYRSLLSFSFIM